MITVRAGSAAMGVCLLLLASGCSREQQDWRSAESADTIEAYGRFIQRHPESELAAQAQTRVAQLGEDQDWQHAGSADTVDAYRQFIAEHPNGKWAQEARIRIENFSLGEQAGTDAASKGGAVTGGPGRVIAAVPGSAAAAGRQRGALASAGEPATPAMRSLAAAAPPAHVAPLAAAPTPPAARSAATPTLPGGGSAATPAPPGGGPGAAPTGAGGFGIQLGAFTTEAGANSEWQVLTGRFGPELQGLHQHLVTVDSGSGRIYRLQATVGDEARARAICGTLRGRGQACVAVLPN